MNMLTVVLILIAGTGFLLNLVRSAQHRRDAERRQRERGAYEGRRESERRKRSSASITSKTDRFFPHVRPDFDSRVAAGDSPASALKEALAAVAGTSIGTTEEGLDVKMPTSLRTRHLVLWGRSGAGKSTAMVHCAKGDIDEGRAVVVLCPEAEIFGSLLGLAAKRAGDVIYLAPADPSCPVTFNPLRLEKDEIPAEHAAVLFTVIKRALGEDSIGPRADALLANAIGLAVDRPAATLETIRQILTDSSYREQAVAASGDEYIRRFWHDVFPTFPSNGSAAAPLLTRLDGFLRVGAIRRTLVHPRGSFTIREAIERRKLLFVDLSGLTPELTLLFGGLLTARLEQELVRRERGLAANPAPVSLFADEFPAVCGLGEGSWATLLSRSRKYNVSLCLAGQFPNQVQVGVRRQIAGNVATLLVFALSARDASVTARDLLAPASDGSLRPISPGDIISLPVGTAFMRIGNSGGAFKIAVNPPLAKVSSECVDQVRRESWGRYASPPIGTPRPGSIPSQTESVPTPLLPAAAPGRGGQQHKHLQHLVREWGESRGFRVSLEETILGGSGRVDVTLVRNDVRVAVEVVITSTPQQVAASVVKSLLAGFSQIVVLSPDLATLRGAESQVAQAVGAGDRDRLHLLTPGDFPGYLDRLHGQEAEPNPAGYRLMVGRGAGASANQRARRRSVARLVATALLRRGLPS
jgi:hypothetical protein